MPGNRRPTGRGERRIRTHLQRRRITTHELVVGVEHADGEVYRTLKTAREARFM